ncbi:insulinase family protein [Alteriqipengyuania lutimaris]|uniref:Insulinase family protein n=1 Tax=Alteriqipengyuania lutimaris TaxID=1538146 RepID=A0A395LL49_9SPHN|nr:insulinase family protein [Alteriqipengyuania lutimaris]
MAAACATPDGANESVPATTQAAPEEHGAAQSVANAAQSNSTPPQAAAPASLQPVDETPWLYEGSNIPIDREWRFGVLDNGLRYATRDNGVPPGQVSIRIRIDAGSLHEEDAERGYAHLLEHLLFRQSRYLDVGETIPTWQRLGATFGNDTNAVTSATSTVYQLDLPEADPAKLDEAFRLLSGMVQAPVINQTNVAAEVPIVLAEKRERGGPGERVATESRDTFFKGQRLAVRPPIGTEETLGAATAEAVQDFYNRWYRPQETVIAVAGDADPVELARLIERYFGDWNVEGEVSDEPDFGDPQAPAGTNPDNPVGETSVLVEPDLPRSLTYGVMRKWEPVQDTISYNEGLLMDALAQSLINRRLEARARGGGDYLYAQVEQEDVSRSTDATFVSFAPLTEDWQAALGDVRAVIADATTTPPTPEELQREIDEFEVAFVAGVEEAAVEPGSQLANTLIGAIDIRETVASAQTVLNIFRGMRERVTPEAMLERTQALFDGEVIRGVYVTPQEGEATAQGLRDALLAPVEADGSARIAASTVDFASLPQIGTPGEVASARPLGVLEIERVELANGVTALLWPNDAEPGRVAVNVHFGAGIRAFEDAQAAYIMLGESALISSGLAGLDQEDLDRLATGRKLGFNFSVGLSDFTFSADTRAADLGDQLYLFAAKLALPEWDARPIARAKAGARIAYDTYATSPAGLLNRDLETLIRGGDPRFATPSPEMIEGTSAEEFREVWEPLLKAGEIEVMIFGDFERDAAIEALRTSFGALPPRAPVDPATLAPRPEAPEAGAREVLTHRGDDNQAAAVLAWPIGSGTQAISEGRQLEILGQIVMNRLFDEMRERAGASYAPQVRVDWPVDDVGGGTLIALAQLRPDDVTAFYAASEEIVADLAANGPTADEVGRVTEPLRQQILRATTGNGFWMWQLRGATRDADRLRAIVSLLDDYSQTTPERMQALAAKYLASREPLEIAIVPEGSDLAR